MLMGKHCHQRVKPAGGVDVLYVYGLDGELLAEVDAGTGQTQREYVWLDGQLMAYLVDGTVYHVHNDHLGTPQALTDESGATVWKASYSPFGKATVTTEQIKFNLRFPGQYFDAETGLHYNWHRYYDPNTGMYITSDPIGLAGGINTYAYALNNPAIYTDPTGQCPWCVFGAAVGGGLNAITQLRSGQDFDWGSFAAATATGALGGGLGTITKGLSWGRNIIANTIGSGGIGVGVTVAKNKVTGSCDDVISSGIRGAVFGGVGAGVGNAFAASGKQYANFMSKKWWDSASLKERLWVSSNAIEGSNLPNRWVALGVTSGNVASNVIANLP
ncbi:type IV secretion protein Rhs [Vibrio parahaemolyticus]|nr:type IV secretion protein Rhs [Vibrio parahaemolyticus]